MGSPLRISNRFQPKSRASTDQPPGPSSANATPRRPDEDVQAGSGRPESACHRAIAAAVAAATGVHRPRSRSKPAASEMTPSATTSQAYRARTGSGVAQQNRARRQAKQHETGARCATSERGIKASHHSNLRKSHTTKTPEWVSGRPLSGRRCRPHLVYWPSQGSGLMLGSAKSQSLPERSPAAASREAMSERFGGVVGRGRRAHRTREKPFTCDCLDASSKTACGSGSEVSRVPNQRVCDGSRGPR